MNSLHRRGFRKRPLWVSHVRTEHKPNRRNGYRSVVRLYAKLTIDVFEISECDKQLIESIEKQNEFDRIAYECSSSD